mmetsp:Transcript_68311/g.149090  ORF Transcript_68311/g.149090 Transcript_68311/m.149090 type:complete len:279 (+) Transcript_68311:115-951(+)
MESTLWPRGRRCDVVHSLPCRQQLLSVGLQGFQGLHLESLLTSSFQFRVQSSRALCLECDEQVVGRGHLHLLELVDYCKDVLRLPIGSDHLQDLRERFRVCLPTPLTLTLSLACMIRCCCCCCCCLDSSFRSFCHCSCSCCCCCWCCCRPWPWPWRWRRWLLASRDPGLGSNSSWFSSWAEYGGHDDGRRRVYVREAFFRPFGNTERRHFHTLLCFCSRWRAGGGVGIASASGRAGARPRSSRSSWARSWLWQQAASASGSSSSSSTRPGNYHSSAPC